MQGSARCVPITHFSVHRLTDHMISSSLLSSAKDGWVLTIITGVGLQSFGRIALAKVYVKTEAVVNAAADAVPAPNADGFDGGARYDGAPGGGDSDGARARIGRRRRDDGDASVERHDSSILLKLNGVSSSIGEVCLGCARPWSKMNEYNYITSSTVGSTNSRLSVVVCLLACHAGWTVLPARIGWRNP